MQDDLYIDTADGLAQLCERLRDSDYIALDTEFMREKNYYPQLCLLQVATDEVIACVDPLAIEDLAPLLDRLYDPALTKVLHAARQDLELLYNLRGEVPVPLFDTQLAATLLGHGDQVSYGALVQETLGVTLDKSHARTDWSRRPLDPEQIRYAADDVRYLRQVYQRQREELRARGRLEWLAEDFAALADPALYRQAPEQAWQRVKGLNTLKGVQLAVLQRLAAWREEQAQRSDKPRRWILRDEVLLDLARRAPQDLNRLEKIRGLESGTVKRHGQTLLEIIAAARQLPKSEWPQPAPRLRLAAEQEALVDAMMAVLRLQGSTQGISTANLAGRRDLEKLAAGNGDDIPLLHGWRRAVAGEAILALLAGRLQLRVETGELRMEAS